MRLKSVLSVLFVVAILLPATVSADGEKKYNSETPRFLTSLNDIPLMPGLEELPEESLVFDKAVGRIGESVAVSEAGRLSRDDIRSFYSRTLPQLGWDPVGDSLYQRQDESLNVRVEKQDGHDIVYFTIEPRTP